MGLKQIRNLLGQKKITQSLWTKKNHATFRDKEKSHNLLGLKNHATSWDKIKSCNLFGQKEVMQPLRTKKIAQPLRTQKNHAASQDITMQKNQIRSWLGPLVLY